MSIGRCVYLEQFQNDLSDNQLCCVYLEQIQNDLSNNQQRRLETYQMFLEDRNLSSLAPSAFHQTKTTLAPTTDGKLKKEKKGSKNFGDQYR